MVSSQYNMAHTFSRPCDSSRFGARFASYQGVGGTPGYSQAGGQAAVPVVGGPYQQGELAWKRFAVNTGSILTALALASAGGWLAVKKGMPKICETVYSNLTQKAAGAGGPQKQAADFLMGTGKELAPLVSKEVLTNEVKESLRRGVRAELKPLITEIINDTLADESLMAKLSARTGTAMTEGALGMMDNAAFMNAVETRFKALTLNLMGDAKLMLAAETKLGELMKVTLKDVMHDATQATGDKIASSFRFGRKPAKTGKPKKPS